MKKIRGLAVLLLVFLFLLPVKGWADDGGVEIVASGDYQGIHWEIRSVPNENGFYDRILVLSGNGPIPDFDHPSSDCVGDVLPPWFRCKMTRYLGDGLTPDPNQDAWWYNTGTGWGMGIRGIEIGAGITAIGDYAFAPATEYANYIEKVVIPDTVTRIGEGAFTTQFDLRELVVPDSVTQFPEYDQYLPVFDHRTKIICSSGSAAYRYAQTAGNPIEASDLKLSLTVNGQTGSVTMKKGDKISYKAVTNVSNITPSVNVSVNGSGNSDALELDTEACKLKALKDGVTATLTASAGGKTSSVQIKVKKRYTITYNLDGGKNNSKNPSAYTEGNSVKLKSPTKKGYKFEGWYTSSYGGTRITSVKDQNITLYAHWKQVTVPQVKKLNVTNQKTRKAVITFGKVQYAKGYQVQYSTKSTFKAGATKSKTITTNKLTLTKLAKNKTYHVRVRAYKLDSKNCKVYGTWSSAVKVKIKK